MKKSLLILFALLTTGTNYAQPALYNTSLNEALLKKGKTVWYIRTVKDSVVIPGGTVVYSNGKLQTANGIVYNMSDGDCIKFKGMLVVCYLWCSKTIDGVKERQHIVRVWSILNQPITLQNGDYAKPNGTIKLPSGSTVTMKSNDFMNTTDNMITAFR